MRQHLVALAGALGLLLPSGLPAAAAQAPPLPLTCGDYSGLDVCSGAVPSFDGTPLDVDLTLPAAGSEGAGGRHPLVVMIHGFGNNKHEWESTADAGDGADKWHWNSHWFAGHGYYVLTYTARGFRDGGPGRPDEPGTPSFSSASLPNGTIHLKSREFEARDTQWLAALTATLAGSRSGCAAAVNAARYTVSRVSNSRLLRWMVPLGALTEP